MDEQNRSDSKNEGVSTEQTLTAPVIPGQSEKLNSPVLPNQENFIDKTSLVPDQESSEVISQSEILAPRQALSESLNSLNDYSNTSESKPEQQVQVEEVTHETKLTVEENPNEGMQPTELYTSEDPNDHSSVRFLKDLYDNGNECMTSDKGSFPVNEETRKLLALFSNGRFFVVGDSRYDGRVLGFEYLAKKRRLQIADPEYVTASELVGIYTYADQIRTATDTISTEEAQRQSRMQRDFVTVISRAAINHVSDIHIVVADHTTVMFRVNGLMQTEMEYNKEWGESFVRAAFASADISDSNYAQNEYQAAQKLGRTPLRGSGGRLVLPKSVLGLRLQFNPIAFGTRYVVIRLLYADDNAAVGDEALESLGFTEYDLEKFRYLRSLPTGIVIVSGPTGSGKSTTLQRNMIAMLKERNYETNLITVEDPPEYPIPGARQMPVTNAGVEEAKDREFTKALAAALRSDPDSLMIGEIRTLSAADLAFRGALSGHNVWSTLHANTAAAVLMRLRDIGVEDFKLQDPSIMRAMLAQRLFRRVCPHCHVAAKNQLNHPAVQRLREAYGDEVLEYTYLRGAGCEECDFRGVNGRLAVAEFIIPDTTFLDLMLKGETQKALNYWVTDLHGRTLKEAAVEHMLRGEFDIEEVERWCGLLNQPNLV